MGKATTALLIKLNGDAKSFIDATEKAKKQTASLESTLKKSAKASAVIFTALGLSIGGAVTRFANFEKGFKNVVTLLDKGSFSTKTFTKGVDDLKKGVLNLRAATGESFESLNQGLFDLISAGVPAEQAIANLKVATDLAKAGATDTATSVKALTASLTAFGSEAGTAQDISEKFFTAQKFGVTTVGELASEFNKVGGLAKQLGLSFDETLSSATALTANGAKPTSQAFTEMKAVINAVLLAQQKLSQFSPEVQSSLALENVQRVGLVKALQETKEALGGNVPELLKLLGSQEALSAALSLTGQQAGLQAKIFTELSDAQKRSATFGDALKTQQETTSEAFKRLTGSVDVAITRLGEALAPTVISLADAVGKLVKKFNDLDDETIQGIANIIRFTTVLAGVVGTLSVAGIAFLKIRGLITGITTALKVGRLAAIGFTSSLTFGLSAIIAFLPEIINGFGKLWDFFNQAEPKSLTETNKKIEELSKRKDDLLKKNEELGEASKVNNQAELDSIDKQLTKLGELQKSYDGINVTAQEASKAVQDFNSANKNVFIKAGFDVDTPNLAPLGKTEAVESGSTDAEKKAEEEKKRIASKELEIERDKAERIKQIRAKNLEILLQQDKEGLEGVVALKKEEVALLTNIDNLETENASIRKKEKASELERVQLEANERELDFLNSQLEAKQLLEEEKMQEFAERKQELKLEQFELDREFDAELNALKEEEKNALEEKELKDLRKSLLTKSKIDQDFAVKKLKGKIKERNDFLADEKEHGTAVATINKFLNKAEIDREKAFGAQFIQLQASRNGTLRTIGKAAAVAEIGISTAKGAIDAYSALAGIPIVGPALGIAAAAALTAYGVERSAQVARYNQGGLVAPSIGGARDRVPSLLEPGEIVVPKSESPNFIKQFGKIDSPDEDSGENNRQFVEISIAEDASEILEAQRTEANVLGIRGGTL